MAEGASDLEKKYLLQEGQTIDDLVPILEGDAKEAYSILRRNIEILNRNYSPYFSAPIYNSNTDDPIKKIRDDINASKKRYIGQRSDRKFLYGIVIDGENGKKDPTEAHIYVDVPGIVPLIITHPDDIANPDFQRDRIEHLKFFPLGNDFSTRITPIKGGIAMVEVSDHFPNQVEQGDPRGNIFIDMKYNNSYVSCQTTLDKLTVAVKTFFQNAVAAGLGGDNSYDPNVPVGPYKIGDKFSGNELPAPNGRVTSLFGRRILNGKPDDHPGIDIGPPTPGQEGAPLHAVMAGEVIYVATPAKSEDGFGLGGNGNVVAIKHGNNFYTTYSHMQSQSVKKGQKVNQGDPIGTMGNTGHSFGAHLHFEHRNQMVWRGGGDPAPLIKRINLKRTPQPQAANDPQNVPEAVQPQNQSFASRAAAAVKNFFGFGGGDTSAQPATSASRPKNRPKMLLIDVPTDLALASSLGKDRGSTHIKVREDIVGDIQNIKNILNFYEIPFTCVLYDINIKNNQLSDFAKVGLEISLNYNAGMTINSSLEKDDYFISPDYSKKIGRGYKLKVFGNVRRKILHEKYHFIDEAYDIYDIKNSYMREAPKIKKIFRPLLDITKIFEDHGFLQKQPETSFFINSDNKKSNWFIFYKTASIKPGSTYRDMLETVYDLKKFPYLEVSNKIWDGVRFNDD